MLNYTRPGLKVRGTRSGGMINTYLKYLVQTVFSVQSTKVEVQSGCSQPKSSGCVEELKVIIPNINFQV